MVIHAMFNFDDLSLGKSMKGKVQTNLIHNTMHLFIQARKILIYFETQADIQSD